MSSQSNMTVSDAACYCDFCSDRTRAGSKTPTRTLRSSRLRRMGARCWRTSPEDGPPVRNAHGWPTPAEIGLCSRGRGHHHRVQPGEHACHRARIAQVYSAFFASGPAPAHVREVSESPVGYATNENDGTVSVIDGRTNTVVATVPVGTFPIGVAVNPKANTAYVTDSGDNTVPVLTSCRGPAAAHGSAVGRCSSTPRFSQFHTGARNRLPSSTRTMLRT